MNKIAICTYSRKDLEKVFLARLSSQRRVFDFDEKQILVLPFLEHNDDISPKIDEIKVCISKNGDCIPFKNVLEFDIYNEEVHVLTNDSKCYSLFTDKINGKYEKVIGKNFELEKLSIDHDPSIYIVLLIEYLNQKSEIFTLLSEYTKKVGINLITKSIKKAGFKAKAKNEFKEFKYNNYTTTDLRNAYIQLFKKIRLHLTLNNTANLSLSSLKFFIENFKD